MRALSDAPRGSVAVIDYLQILDQRRDRPDLDTQVRRLRDFAGVRGLVLVFLSQIARSYDPGERPVPGWADIRLSNPLDLALFDRALFLNGGEAILLDGGRPVAHPP